MQKWQYALLTESPAGPIVMTRTIYGVDGMERKEFVAASHEEGTEQLRPRLIAEMGLDGWEMFAVSVGGWHFKRPLPNNDAT